MMPEGSHAFTQLLGVAPNYWAFHSITGPFTQLLGFHPTSGLFTRLLGFAPDDWAVHSAAGLPTRLLDFAPDYRGLHADIKGFCTRLRGIQSSFAKYRTVWLSGYPDMRISGYPPTREPTYSFVVEHKQTIFQKNLEFRWIFGFAGGFSMDFRVFGILRQSVDFRVFGFSGFRNSGIPEIRNSGFPDFRISGYPNIRISRYPDIRITDTGSMSHSTICHYRYRFQNFRIISVMFFAGVVVGRPRV